MTYFLIMTIWLDANNTLSVPWWTYGIIITVWVFRTITILGKAIDDKNASSN